ncbi:MAG: TIR domain-containing protein [Alphaproteobacteria bacterium]
MASVFVSYASEDAASARAVADGLRALGLTVWMAPDSILPGQDYAGAIVAGVRDADGLCVLVSPAANASKHVMREVALADTENKRIIPVRLSPVEPSDALGYYLHLPQWVEYHRDGAAALTAVAAVLGGGAIPTPTPPPGRAATITIARKSALMYAVRKFELFLDGAPIGKLANGETIAVEVAPGPHRLSAALGFNKSEPLDFTVLAGTRHLVDIEMTMLDRFKWTLRS